MRGKKGQGGFTLSEVMISVGLLAVALLAVIGIFTSAIKLQSQSQERSAATDWARRLIERIRATPSNVPAAPFSWYGGEMASTPTFPGPPQFPPLPYPYIDGFSFDVHLEPSPRPGVKLVKVVVHWDEGKQLELQTLIRE